MIGGGFGRRLEAEYVGIATTLAKQVPFPLKMIWTRETDIRGRYRPFYCVIGHFGGKPGKVTAQAVREQRTAQ
jgi:CO/xanthine dehydrogenase Mo-binding subunit